MGKDSICQENWYSLCLPWFPQPKKYYFTGHNYHFPGLSIQYLNEINQDMYKKAYHSCSMYDQLLTFLW